VRQTADFITDVPSTINEFQNQDSTLANFVRRYNLNEQLNDLSRDFSRRVIPQVRGEIFSTATRIGSTIVSVITVLVLTFMMLVEGPLWIRRFWALQPSRNREHNKILARKMYRVVTGYVNGQLLVAIIAGAFALVALLITSTLLDVSINAVALAGIIALTGLIPMIGATIGAVIVVFISLLASAPLALIMAIFFLIYQQIENVTIQPYIQSRQNELTPLLVFIAALVGVGFGGILGAFIAIPAAGCIKIGIEEYLTRKKMAHESVTVDT
jgi:predicted PurR-regulated permease PerM